MGATVNGSIRTIIGDYTQDMGPGPWGGDPLAAVHRIYKVEKSMLASPLDFADFQEWPVDFGAPWVDVDGDGVPLTSLTSKNGQLILVHLGLT